MWKNSKITDSATVHDSASNRGVDLDWPHHAFRRRNVVEFRFNVKGQVPMSHSVTDVRPVRDEFSCEIVDG